jgi:hypothetical protein
MTPASFPGTLTAPEALARFYAEQALPDGGTDGALLDWGSAFGIPIPIVNTRARFEALPYHDLHHLVAGYGTDEAGEAEISGWTLGTGGGSWFGEVYDSGAFLLGMVRFPRRTIRAFYRGRQCRNLYRRPAEHWVQHDLATLRAYAGTDAVAGPDAPIPAEAITTMDRIDLVRATLVAAALWLTPLVPLYIAWTVVLDRLGPRADAPVDQSVAKP